MRLIDADAFIDDLYEHEFSNWCDKDEVSTLVYDAPTIEPKRGEWTYHENKMSCVRWNKWECSVCHKNVEYKTDFCPNCGAQMKGAYDEQ